MTTPNLIHAQMLCDNTNANATTDVLWALTNSTNWGVFDTDREQLDWNTWTDIINDTCYMGASNESRGSIDEGAVSNCRSRRTIRKIYTKHDKEAFIEFMANSPSNTVVATVSRMFDINVRTGQRWWKKFRSDSSKT